MLQKMGRAGEAVEACRCAVAFDPALAAGHYNMGNALRDAGELNEAVAAFEMTIRLAPEHARARTNLANLLWRAGQLERAVAHYEAVLRLGPGSADAHNNLAAALLDCDRFDLAGRHAQAAVDLDPQHAGARNNLGVALQYQGRLDEAIDAYRAALAISPKYAEAHHNLFWALQLGGFLQEGWREHAWRERVFPGSILQLPVKRWDGSPLERRRIAVYAEQGIGDEIMFASCLPQLVESANAVTVQCDPRLGPLFKRSFPGVVVYAEPRDSQAAQWRVALEEADAQAPAGDLPHYLRRDFRDFNDGAAFLHADPRQVARFQARLGQLGDGLKVGIAWRGGSRPKDRRRRSIGLDQWQPILHVPGVRFVSLQYGRHQDELDRANTESGVPVHVLDGLDATSDLDGLAALMTALDLVVSVDSSAVHLAGAVGSRAWVLLPFVPDWRWYLGGGDTPWYKSITLYRQTTWAGWDDVISRVADDLAAFAALRAAGSHASGRPMNPAS
jgi:hypothetical protein